MTGAVRNRYLWTLAKTFNRLTVRLAKSGRGPFALVRHVGRRSGRQYETPVILARVPQGFVAELTYGSGVDWYKNITAAGRCTVVHHGREYEVGAITDFPEEQGLAAFPAPARVILTALGRHEFRLLAVPGVA